MSYPYKICDPVHGFIRFGELERKVVDSLAFQRLRYIHQMGVAYLVYPGASHTRFEHSLGVMELVTRIFNTICADLPKEQVSYWRQILRFAALVHDLGHLPFSHTAEKVLLPEKGHEGMTMEIIGSPPLKEIWQEYGSEAGNDIIKLCISDCGLKLTPFEKLLSQIITEDNFGADRIDYLLRDSYYTGVKYGNFDHHQLIDSLRILPKDGLTLGVTAAGVQSVESLWIARYMMYARVYRHPKARIFTKHMTRFMQQHYDQTLPFLDQTDFTILTSLLKAAKQGDYDAQVLLKMKPSYEEVSCNSTVDLSKFGEKVLIDSMPLKKGQREFPVLNDDGEVISSFEASPFLSEIPIGSGKPVQIYAHPDFIKQLKDHAFSE